MEKDFPDWMALAELETPNSPMAPAASTSLARFSSDGFEAAEVKLHGEAITILDHTFAAREIAPGDEQPPPEWIAELGMEKAMNKLRVANAGWLPAKDAPAFVQTARAFAVGRMKSEATKKGGARTLNVQFVQMAVAPQQFDEIEVTREK